MKNTIVLLLFLLILNSNYAQVSLFTMPSFELPLSFPKYPSYSPATGLKMGILKNYEKYSLGLSIGIHSFSPKEKSTTKTILSSIAQEFEYYETQEFGKINYIPILIEWNQNLIHKDKFTFYTGFNMGVMIFNYTHVASRSDSVVVKSYRTNKTDGGVNLSTKLGMKWEVKKHLSIFIETSINLHFEELGDFSAPFETNGYQTSLLYSWTTGIGIAYNFTEKIKKNNEWLGN